MQLGGPGDGKVTMLTDDLMPIAEKPQRRSAQDVARMKQAEKRQQGNNSAKDARRLNKSERKQHNARTDVDHRTAREKQRDKDYHGKTGSQVIQDKKDAAYWETRGRNTHQLAKESMKELIKPLHKPIKDADDWLKRKSHIRRDMEAIINSDYTTMSSEEKMANARKYAQLVDMLPFDPLTGAFADAAAFEATKYDIDKADVAFWNKAGAHVFNYIGLLGNLPGAGPVFDAATYEIISNLLEKDVD